MDDFPETPPTQSLETIAEESDPIKNLTNALLETTREKSNKYDLFGAQIAEILKEMTPSAASKASIEILQLLHKYQFE